MEKSKRNLGLAAEIAKIWYEFLDSGMHRGIKILRSNNGRSTPLQNLDLHLRSLGLSMEDYESIFRVIPKETASAGGTGSTNSGNRSIAIGSWNIQQGIRYGEIIEALQAESGLDGVMIQEITRNHRWSDYQDLLEKIVKETKYTQVFYSPSFTLAREPRPFPEIGNAILSRHRLSNGRVVRLGQAYDWSQDKPYPKLGERIALYATMQVNSESVEVCSTHLEVRCPTSSRLKQLERIFGHADLAENPRVIIAGDFNEWYLSTPRHETDEITRLARVRGYMDPFGESSERTMNNFWLAMACYFLNNGKFTNDRIFSKGFKIKGFEVMRNIAITDHFPIKVIVNY